MMSANSLSDRLTAVGSSATCAAISQISVCICTYKRPQMLRRLLNALATQRTDGLFTYEIVIADNDESRSAEPLAKEFATAMSIPIIYCVEARQNIALARNKAIECSSGDFIAFIDDDEFPIDDWLLTLFTVCAQRQVDGVLGPVKPHFDESAPKWVIQGKFYDRSSYPTGEVIDWRKGRTGNVLLKRSLFSGTELVFRPEFRTGEDQDFFGRMIDRGHVFIWCNEAVAYEVVPPTRWSRKFLLKRYWLRGAMEPKTPEFGAPQIAKSLIAALLYSLLLPLLLVLSHGLFMLYATKLSYHLGTLFATFGVNPIRDAYITS
jgi:succinoglycan biosynthesis protein ExoM